MEIALWEIMKAPDQAKHIAMERDTLRLLCSMLIKRVTRVEICGLVDATTFVDPLQRILFEEIRSLGALDATKLRQLLPVRVNKRGFPDFDLQELLTPDLVSEQEIEQLQSALRLIEIQSDNESMEAN
jgi:hypothetical protein